MAEQQDKQERDEKPTGTVQRDVEVESTVDDPSEPREDTVARQRSTSPVPRVGDTWEDMHDHGTSGPQRRVGILSIDGEDCLVENKVTRHKSHIGLDKFCPPNWRFIG